MSNIATRAICACVFVAGALQAFAADNFWVSGGKLMRGSKPFTIRAVQAPELAASAGKVSDMVPSFVKASWHGADAVWFDLPGLSADGAHLDPLDVETIGTMSNRAKDTRLAVVVRVLPEGHDAKWRQAATETAAAALKDRDLALYWFDGDDAAKLAKVFKKLAPKCCVIAPESGDVISVTDAPAQPDALRVLLDKIPADPWSDQHFILRGGDDTVLKALDDAMTRPEEKAPFTPDNSQLSEEERKDGFESMFNGKDLSGWWIYGKAKDGFKVTPEGTIAWVHEGGEGVMSRKRYKDFIFRWEFKLAKDGDNSGTYIRAPRAGRQSKLGFEFQEMGDAGKAPDTHVTGAVYDVVPPKVNAALPVGQWNKAEVEFRGGHLKATLNGQVIHDFDFDTVEELKYRNREGFIGLQDHACQAEWRNLRIKEL